jgi:hypothetical protein
LATSCKWRIAKLLDRLQNGTHRGKGGGADQSIHGRMGLWTACREETLMIKNVLIESSGGRKLCLWIEENCVPTKKIPIYIYTAWKFYLLSELISYYFHLI